VLDTGSTLEIQLELVRRKSSKAVKCVELPHHHLTLMRSKPRVSTRFGYHTCQVIRWSPDWQLSNHLSILDYEALILCLHSHSFVL
jgi:hypothetical protein